MAKDPTAAERKMRSRNNAVMEKRVFKGGFAMKQDTLAWFVHKGLIPRDVVDVDRDCLDAVEELLEHFRRVMSQSKS